MATAVSGIGRPRVLLAVAGSANAGQAAQQVIAVLAGPDGPSRVALHADGR